MPNRINPSDISVHLPGLVGFWTCIVFPAILMIPWLPGGLIVPAVVSVVLFYGLLMWQEDNAFELDTWRFLLGGSVIGLLAHWLGVQVHAVLAGLPVLGPLEFLRRLRDVYLDQHHAATEGWPASASIFEAARA